MALFRLRKREENMKQKPLSQAQLEVLKLLAEGKTLFKELGEFKIYPGSYFAVYPSTVTVLVSKGLIRELTFAEDATAAVQFISEANQKADEAREQIRNREFQQAAFSCEAAIRCERRSTNTKYKITDSGSAMLANKGETHVSDSPSADPTGTVRPTQPSA